MKPLTPDTFNITTWDLTQRLAACLFLVGLTPVMAVLALLVKATSRGPVLYRQSRPGLYGRPFEILKFRTMYVGSDADPRLQLGVQRAEARVTAVGRVMRQTKLDELPQLWNVVRGEMTLVGPRAIGPVLDRQLQSCIEDFSVRYLVKPGMTNLGQVSINENSSDVVADWKRRFQAEQHYVANRCVRYDLVILLVTMLFLIRRVADR